MKRIAAIVMLVLVVSTASVFAKETKSADIPWMASFDHGGDLNLYAAAGLSYWGLNVSGGPEFMISQFDVGPVPLSFGIMVRGLVAFPVFLTGYDWMEWGVAPMASLHWAVDFGAPWKFDFYATLGLGIYGFTGTYSSYFSSWGYGAVNFGFASFQGVAWHFSDNFALILDSGYVGWTYSYGLGIKVKL